MKKNTKRSLKRLCEKQIKREISAIATVYKARDVLKNGSEEDIQAIKEGKTSIKKVYNTNNQKASSMEAHHG